MKIQLDRYTRIFIFYTYPKEKGFELLKKLFSNKQENLQLDDVKLFFNKLNEDYKQWLQNNK